MEKSFPFNAVVVDGTPDRVYTAEDFARERAAYVSNGVTAEDGLLVNPSSAGGLAVDVAVGAAVIDGYTYWNTAALTLALAPADELLPRVDAVVLRLDHTARSMYCAVKTGTPAEAPVSPACEHTGEMHEMLLATVAVSAGDLVVEIGHVTDCRIRADYILNRMEVEEALAEYKAALESFFTTADAEKLAAAADIVRTDAGADTVLCGDGVYRERSAGGGQMTELVRFTASGTFCPADYPTIDGMYTILLQGGGGSGGFGNFEDTIFGGAAGGFYVAPCVPLDSTQTYTVTVGLGGKGVTNTTSLTSKNGRAGSKTGMAGFIVQGGEGGKCAGASQTKTQTCIHYAETGEKSETGAGGDSFLGRGGKNKFTADAVGDINGGIGAGGGASGVIGQYSGNGGDGAVIIYGYPL